MATESWSKAGFFRVCWRNQKSLLIMKNPALGTELCSEVFCASVKTKSFQHRCCFSNLSLKNQKPLMDHNSCSEDCNMQPWWLSSRRVNLTLCLMYNNTFYSHLKQVRPNNKTSSKENVNQVKSSTFTITGHKPPVCLVSWSHSSIVVVWVFIAALNIAWLIAMHVM